MAPWCSVQLGHPEKIVSSCGAPGWLYISADWKLLFFLKNFSTVLTKKKKKRERKRKEFRPPAGQETKYLLRVAWDISNFRGLIPHPASLGISLEKKKWKKKMKKK